MMQTKPVDLSTVGVKMTISVLTDRETRLVQKLFHMILNLKYKQELTQVFRHFCQVVFKRKPKMDYGHVLNCHRGVKIKSSSATQLN